MKYCIDKNSGKAAYIQIYRQIKEDIIEGRFPKGARLPSKRRIAEETGLSLITVEHAYALLCDEGYVCARERSGYFVDFGAGAAPEKPLPLGSASGAARAPEDFPFSTYAKIMRKVLSEQDRRLLVRCPNAGCEELRNVLSAYLARSRGVSVDAERIIIGSGAEHLYSMIAQLLGRGREIALEDPCYDKIRKVYEANGLNCRSLRLGAEGIVSCDLEKSCAAALHVTPFNSYPSGVTASAAKRHEYAEWARKRGTYIVEDDYDSEFASPKKQVETIYSLCPERVVYINTFSKTIAPSVRIGYMVLPEALSEKYRRELGFYSCTVPVFDQLVLAEYIDSGEFERYINRRRRKLRGKVL